MLHVCSSPCLSVGQAQHTDYDSATSVLFPLPGSRLEGVVLVWFENSRPPNPGTSWVEGVQCPNSCPESCPDSCPGVCGMHKFMS